MAGSTPWFSGGTKLQVRLRKSIGETRGKVVCKEIEKREELRSTHKSSQPLLHLPREVFQTSPQR